MVLLLNTSTEVTQWLPVMTGTDVVLLRTMNDLRLPSRFWASAARGAREIRHSARIENAILGRKLSMLRRQR